MVHLNKDFKVVHKDKIIIWSIVGIVALIALGNWVATSFGNFDNHMSEIFYKGMDINFFRGWAAYTIMDGYTVVISYLIPSGILLVECLLIFVKKAKPNWWVSQHASWYKYFILIVSIIFEVAIILSFYFWNYKDQGFGEGFSMEFVVGKEYTIPSFVVSVLLGNVVFWTLVWWYHCKLAKRKDLLELKVWRPIVTIFIFMALSYIVCQGIVKQINPRPYWYAIHFDDGLKGFTDSNGYTVTGNGSGIEGNLARFKRLYPDAFNYYLTHNTGHHYGWFGSFDPNTSAGKLQVWPTTGDMRDFKWFRNANGYPFYSMPAFPSGHMIATTIICLTPWVAFPGRSQNKKVSIAKTICWTLAGLYMLDMIFSLQITASHYWSDIMFTVGFDPIYFLMGYYITYGVFKGFNKYFKTTKW